jgi:putative hydrolase of the HAD superfamily
MSTILSPADETMSAKKHFKVQSVVFDLFHTLVDPEDYRPKDFRRATKLAELFKIDVDAFSKYWSETHQERYTSRSRKTLDYVQKYVEEATGNPCSRNDLGIAEFILGRYQDLAIRNPDPMVRQTLAKLKYGGVKLGLLSNVDERDVSAWPYSSLASLFDAVCFSYDIGYTKPSKEAYSMVLNRLGTLAQSSFYVGDGGSDELQGAKDGGFGLVVFMRGYVAKNGLKTQDEIRKLTDVADLTIDNVTEIPLLIDKVEKG